MTAPAPLQYQPNIDYSGNSTDTTAGVSSATAAAKLTYLPDGSMDLYGLGDIAGKSIFTGESQYQGYGGQYQSEQQTGQMTPQYSQAYQLVQQFAKQSVTDESGFTDLQSQMYNAGMYGSSTATPHWGTWTSKDGLAVTEALRGYLAVAQTGVPITFSEWLDRASKLGQANAAAMQTPVTLTDSTTLKADANTAGQNSLGRNLTASEQQGFVDQFHDKELDAQLAKRVKTGPDGTRSVEVPSRYDAVANATQDVQTNDNAEYQQKLQSDYMDRLNQMLGVK